MEASPELLLDKEALLSACLQCLWMNGKTWIWVHHSKMWLWWWTWLRKDSSLNTWLGDCLFSVRSVVMVRFKVPCICQRFSFFVSYKAMVATWEEKLDRSKVAWVDSDCRATLIILANFLQRCQTNRKDLAQEMVSTMSSADVTLIFTASDDIAKGLSVQERSCHYKRSLYPSIVVCLHAVCTHVSSSQHDRFLPGWLAQGAGVFCWWTTGMDKRLVYCSSYPTRWC